jgi:addiction module HigA family antidote
MNSKRILANDLVPGSAIHPGQLLKEELDARGMKQIELANELGIAKNVMSEILNGKRNISPEMAVRLEDTLGIKAEFWMNYQMAYEIDKIRIKNKKVAQ